MLALALAIIFSGCAKEPEKLPDDFIQIPTLETEQFHFYPQNETRLIKGQKFDFYLNVTPVARMGFTKRAGELMFGDKNVMIDLYPDEFHANALSGVVRGLSIDTIGEVPFEIRVEGGRIFQGKWKILNFKPENALVKNIIIAIDDGAGAGLKAAARLAKGVEKLESEKLPVSGILTPVASGTWAADSAAVASAMSSGQAPRNGQMGVFPDHTEKDPLDNPSIQIIPEMLAEFTGRALGLVTTTRVTDATMAAWASHTSDRNYLRSIAESYVTAAEKYNLKVIMGGDAVNFKPDRNRNLDDLSYKLRTMGFVEINNRQQLQKELQNPPERILGLFADSHMSPQIERMDLAPDTSNNIGLEQPQLTEMVRLALAALEKNQAGFVLIVESGLIEKMLQLHDGHRAMYDELEFDNVVKMLRQYVEGRNDTLLITTAGHEVGGVAAVGTTDPVNLGRPEYLSLTKSVSYKDANQDGYPDAAAPAEHFAFDFAARVDRFENWSVLSKIIPPAINAADGIIANPRRQLRFSKVIYGNLPTGKDGGEKHVLAPPVATDVTINSIGEGADFFSGRMYTSDIFYRILDLTMGLEGYEDKTPALKSGSRATNIILMTAGGAGSGLPALARAAIKGDLAADGLPVQGRISVSSKGQVITNHSTALKTLYCGQKDLSGKTDTCMGLGPELKKRGGYVWGYIGPRDVRGAAMELAGLDGSRPDEGLGLVFSHTFKQERELPLKEDPVSQPATLGDEVTAGLAALESEKHFMLLVEYEGLVPFLREYDSERVINQMLDFNTGVKAALNYINKVNGDDNPDNDTLLVVTSDSDIAGPHGIGVTRAIHKLPHLRDDIIAVTGSPSYKDNNANGFPDEWDTPNRVVIGWTSRTRFKDDRLPNPSFEPAKKRDINGILISENIWSPQAENILADVPITAAGPGAELFSGLVPAANLSGMITEALGL